MNGREEGVSRGMRKGKKRSMENERRESSLVAWRGLKDSQGECESQFVGDSEGCGAPFPTLISFRNQRERGGSNVQSAELTSFSTPPFHISIVALCSFRFTLSFWFPFCSGSFRCWLRQNRSGIV